MPQAERIELYKEIEGKRGRPLIAYITSMRPGATGNIAGDVVLEFTKQIKAIDTDSKDVDLLIVSNGGDPTVSWRIISLLRERFDKIGALLPFAAYSAATLLSLGANEIVMHPFSNLGPVDPQLVYVKKIPGQDGIPGRQEPVQFGAEDLRHFTKYAREEIGITDQEQLGKIFELVCNEVGTIPIGVAKRSSHLAVSMGEQLLNLHLNDTNQAKAIAEALNSSFYHHGYALGRTEAKKIGLPITTPDADLAELLWRVWEDFDSDMLCSRPFNPMEIVLNDPGMTALFAPTPVAQIPQNIPPQLAQQVFQQIMSQIQITSVNPVDYELFQAAVESIRCRSHFRSKFKLSATRTPDMNIAVSMLQTDSKWSFENA